MTWWRKERPSRAGYEPLRHPIEIEAELREAERIRREEGRQKKLEARQSAFDDLNAQVDTKIPDYGTHNDCPACGATDPTRTFELKELRPDGHPEVVVHYNLMNVVCWQCGFKIGIEKARNFALPETYSYDFDYMPW